MHAYLLSLTALVMHCKFPLYQTTIQVKQGHTRLQASGRKPTAVSKNRGRQLEISIGKVKNYSNGQKRLLSQV